MPTRGLTRAARGLAAATTLAVLAIPAAWQAPPVQAAEAPHIDATWATGVSASAATVHAEVNPEGAATTYRFEYIAAGADYQAHGFEHALKQPSGAPAGIGSGTADVQALQHLVPLTPSTLYHYRVVATSHCNPLEPAEVCAATGEPHIFTTQEAGAVFSLPDARGWEMISPVDKNGGAIQGFGANFGGDVLQAAAQGGAVTYSSSSSFGAGAEGAPHASQYLSRREAGGWSTENLTAPTVSGSYGEAPDGVPYRLFSPDLARGLMLNGERCRGSEGECPVANPPLPGSGAPAGYQDYYLREDEAGGFTALLTAANAELGLPPEQFEVSFAGASPDLRHVVLSTCAKLTAEATEVPSGGGGCVPAEANLYEWSEGGLRLVNLLPGETHGTPGARLAAQAGAISTDGRRVYFTDEGKLFLRRNATQPQSALGGGACTEAAKACTVEVKAGGRFQTATPDGSVTFFTKEEHLYRYPAGGASTDLTPSGGVVGVLGASAAGTAVYYQDGAGLELWREGAGVATVAGGAEAAAPSDYPPSTGTARLSADGTRLLFLSAASLTGFDNTDQASGQPDSEVFLYDAAANSGAGELSCVSCNPTNARPLGPSTIPGATPNGTTNLYKPRNLSANGARVFFNSADALVPADTDGRPDVYQWEAQGEGACPKAGGCLALISGGRSGEASFIDASESGADAFFLTEASLVGADPGSVDLYDAREGGGFAETPPPFECIADACQPLPEPPEDPTVGTLIPGEANPPLHLPKPRCPKGKRRVVRHGKPRCVPQHHKQRHRAGSPRR